MWDDDFQDYVKREAQRVVSELYDPPEYFPPEWNTRHQSIDKQFASYKEHIEKDKLHQKWVRTLIEIQSLAETTTDYGD